MIRVAPMTLTARRAEASDRAPRQLQGRADGADAGARDGRRRRRRGRPLRHPARLQAARGRQPGARRAGPPQRLIWRPIAECKAWARFRLLPDAGLRRGDAGRAAAPCGAADRPSCVGRTARVCVAAPCHVRPCFAPAARAGRLLALRGSWPPRPHVLQRHPPLSCAAARVAGRAAASMQAYSFAQAASGGFGERISFCGAAPVAGFLEVGASVTDRRRSLCLVMRGGGAMHCSCMSGFFRVCCAGSGGWQGGSVSIIQLGC